MSRSPTPAGDLAAGPRAPDVERLVKVSEAAHLLGVSIRTVWRMRSEGVLPAVELPSTKGVRFRLSSLRALVNASTLTGPTGKPQPVALNVAPPALMQLPGLGAQL